MKMVAKKNSKPSVFFVDDEPEIINSLFREVRNLDLEPHGFYDPIKALSAMSEFEPDLIVSDVKMPHMNGIELLDRAAEKLPYSERILLSGYADMEEYAGPVNQNSVHRYFSKPWDSEELKRTLIEGLDSTRERKNTAIISARDDEVGSRINDGNINLGREDGNIHSYSGSHTNISVLSRLLVQRFGSSCDQQVSRLCGDIAKQLGVASKDVMDLKYSVFLRHLGKLHFDSSLLSEPLHKLSFTQLEKYHQHPIFAALLMSGSCSLKGIEKILLEYCEQPDGGGYPNNTSGDEVEILSNILLLSSDYYDGVGGQLGQASLSNSDFLVWMEINRNIRYHECVVDSARRVLEMEMGGDNYGEEIALSVENLKPGMVLSRDLKLVGGPLLLPEGTCVHASQVHYVQQISALNEGDLHARVYRIH